MSVSITVALLYYSALLSTFIPIFVPLIYGFIGGLLLRGEDPLIIAIAVFLGAISGTVSLWFADEKLIKRLKKKKILKKFNGVSGDSRIKRTTKSLHTKLQIVNKRWTLFLLTCFTTWSAVPDFVVIRCVRSKLGFPLFVIASIIGKLFVYTPVIYGIGLIDLIIQKFM